MAASKYPDEIRPRAVRMVFEVCKQTGDTRGVIARVARQLGVGAETLRLWVRKAEVDEGLRPGLATAEAQRVAALERENRELRRADEILKARPRLSSRASSTLDRPGDRLHRPTS
jgi:transposase